MTTTAGLTSAINYMIPAIGTPRMYAASQVLVSGTPVHIDFTGVSGGYWDGQPFRPSGFYIDNTQGTAPLTIVINPIAYQVVCPAGGSLNLPFPAPVDCTVDFSGVGQTTIVFVDTPVMPYRSF